MIEVGAKEISEKDLKEGLALALKEIEKIQKFQEDIIKEIGREKILVTKPEIPVETEKIFNEIIKDKIEEAVFSGAGNEKIAELEEEWVLSFGEKIPEADINLAKVFFENKVNEIIHKEAIEKGKRPDGRKIDEIRPLFAKAGSLSKMVHGSGIFYRGGTHILSVLTLGGPGDTQLIDGMEIQTQKRFMHHYNFPPFSSGETGRVGGFNRRMIGHGALAEKALSAVLPERDAFPYTIRIVSECLASNGSTSMGSVCAGTLALLDGGVPIKRAVAGIAIGLMMKNRNKYKILTDIQGPEDHHGDMDFKIAGTTEGVTAVQMDVKVSGIPLHILEEALERGRIARLQILEKIKEEISEPRKTLSPNAPQIILVKIKPEQIGLVIGSGGKTINQIKKVSDGAEIDIEDDGSVFITGKGDSAKKAAEIIKEMTREYQAGERLNGEVTKIVDFGAFVKIGPNAEGLLHISEIAPMRIERVDKVLSVGESVPVIIKAIDEQGKIKLSLKEADPDFVKNKTNQNGAYRKTTRRAPEE
jgi:polyribonucleotide nucleotidyltransferase